MPIAAPIPSNESDRLAALHAMEVLDTPADPRLDRITKFAAQVFEAPICLVSFVDSERQWFKSRFGLEATETPRCLAFCAYAILGDDVFIVPDATADPSFADSPLVVGPPHIRTYIGAPLIDADGHRLGTLCLIYDRVTPFSAAQAAHLKTLAAVVMDGLRLVERNRVLKAANSEIERQRRLFEAVEDLAHVGGWRYDVSTDVVTWSREVYAIKEADPNVTPNYEFALSFYPPQARTVLTEAVAAAVTEAKPYTLELPLVTASGRHLWIHALGRPIVEDGVVTELVGAFQDITERRAFEDELRRRREEAEAANKAKSRFLAAMSHEIRTPINAITGMATALLRDDLPPKHRDHVNVINDASRVLEYLLNDILDLSKAEAGQIDIEHVVFSLADLIRSLESVFALKARDKGLAFTVTCEDALDGVFVGDPTRLHQVFANLISNALKFTDAGRVDVAVHIKPTGQAGVFDLVGVVRDTGPGVPAEAQERIFDDFAQEDVTVHRRHGGTGLGLSISRSLCQLMGGDITLDSTVGVGSTFTFTARVRAAQEADGAVAASWRAPVSASGEEGSGGAGSGGEADGARPAEAHGGESPEASGDAADGEAAVRVLVAEDNANNRAVFSALLEPFELDLRFVANGREAVDAWAQGDIDVILMDVQMPVMCGVEATREIRRREDDAGLARTPIIAVTANVMKHQLNEYAEAGMDCCVGKPIRLAELIEAINAVATDDGADASGDAARA